MRDCCEIPPAASGPQRRMLHIVLAINAAMFVVEFVAGLWAHSTALLADSVDMLGDALVYGLSLYAVGRGGAWPARAALAKGLIMAAFGAGVLLEAVLKVLHGLVPRADVMGSIGLLALVANVACLVLLTRRRGDDINMRSAWLCSRNDVLANAGVLLGAGGVALTGLAWPDILVGLLIAAVFGVSAIGVVWDARRELDGDMGGPDMAPRTAQAKGAMPPPPSDSPGQRSGPPGQAGAPLDTA